MSVVSVETSAMCVAAGDATTDSGYLLIFTGRFQPMTDFCSDREMVS